MHTWALRLGTWTQEGQGRHPLPAPPATPVNVFLQTHRQPTWRAVTSYLPPSIKHFLSFREKNKKKKINTFPFSELMSNDLETLPLGAEAIEQSSISSSSSDSSISAAPGEGGRASTTASLECHRLHCDPFDNSLWMAGLQLFLRQSKLCINTTRTLYRLYLHAHKRDTCSLTNTYSFLPI